MAIAAVLSDCDAVEDIACWARAKEDWLCRFLGLKNGIPSEETFLRILRALDPMQFENAFRRWADSILGTLGGTLAVDGKTVGGSGIGGESAIHTIGRIDSLGIVSGKESELERRHYISSCVMTAAEVTTATRAHWGIENRLLWVLDVTLGEDASTLRKQNAQKNASLLRKIALNLIRSASPPAHKTSLRLRPKGATWDDDEQNRILGITIL